MKTRRSVTPFAVLVAVLLLFGCVTNPALEESRRLLAEGHLDEGVLRLEQAMREAPDDHELRVQYFRQRDLAMGRLLAEAEAARQPEQAEAIYRRMQKLDASDRRAPDGLARIAAERRQDTLLGEAVALLDQHDDAAAELRLRGLLAENPLHGEARRLLQGLRDQAARTEAPALALKASFSKPITLEFRDTPLKTVFEVLARSSGINFVFDKDVKADTKVAIFVRDTGIDEVVKLILATNQLEQKLLNGNSVLIYPDTPAKAKDYQELVTRSFYLANADVKQAQELVRMLVKTKDIFVDEKLNLLVIKDTAAAVRLAERLLESLDMAEPEVMLEVEVLEMTRSKLLELGVRFPDAVGYGLIEGARDTTVLVDGVPTSISTTPGGTVAPGVIDLRNRAGITSFVANPALTLNLKNQASDGNLLANPRIRVKNREKASIHIGEKLPIFTTTSTANVGVSASVSYLDVGLKLEVEPTVHLEGEVSIRVGLEVSSIVKEIPGPADSLAYQIGTRSAATVLRLKNGETQVLAGLINDEERSSADRLPGLGDIPLLGRLFSSRRGNSSKTEIVLLITPRIVRDLTRSEAVSATVPAGSELSVGAPALQVRETEPHGLSLSFQPGAGPTAAEAVPLEPAAEPGQPLEPPVAPPAAMPLPAGQAEDPRP